MRKLLLLFCLVTVVSNSMAANIHIGPNGCSLEDAIDSANFNSAFGNCAAGSGSDFIIAPDDWEVLLSSPLPTINSDVTIRSASSAGIFYILGDDTHRVLKIVGNNTNVTLNRVQIGGGRADAIDGEGAGIRIENATVRLENSIVVSNESRSGGIHSGLGSGIYVVNGDLTIDHSEVQGNRIGAGVYAVDSTVHIVNSTFTHNPGGGMRLKDSELLVENSLFNEFRFGIGGEGSVAEIYNSTFASNIPNSYDRPRSINFSGISAITLNHVTLVTESRFTDTMLNVSNSFIAACEMFYSNVLFSSHNLYQSSFGNLPPNCLGLTPENYGVHNLADNGGPTQTNAIGSVNSVAIHGGDPAHCQEFDQRGELRGAQCDVGAFEVTGLADVEVNSRIEPGAPFASNQQITYYAEIKNNGPGIATSVELDIDTSFAYVDSVDSPFCNAVDCIISSIQPGQTLIIPVQMALANYINSPFQVDLSAHTSASSTYIDADEDDPGGNNRNSTTFDINPAADLAVEMELLTPAPFGIGQIVEYEATISNHGPQTANGIALEFLPDNLGIVQFTGCTSVSGETCSVANIGKGDSRTVEVLAKIEDAQFNAVATVESNLLDHDTSNNTDDEINGGGVEKADIQVSLEALDVEPYTSLQYIQFKIVVSTGEKPASFIRLYYEFPGSEYISIDGCADYPCIIPSLAADSKIELIARFFAPLAIPGTIDTWSMRVLALPGQLDADLSNNEATMVMRLNPVADVAAQLNLISEPPFYVGQEIQYSLRVANGGPNAVTSVGVELTPENLSLLYANGYLCPSVDCLITQMNAFDEENITLIYQIDDIGAFDLTGSAKAAEMDSKLSNNTDSSNNGGVAVQPPLPDRPDEIFKDDFES